MPAIVLKKLTLTIAWFQDVLARLQFSEQRLLPSWWLSTGLLEAAHPVELPDGRPRQRRSIAPPRAPAS